MTLRFKALGLTLLAFLLLIAIIHSISYRFIMPTYISLEKQEAEQNILRVSGAISNELSNIEITTKDWAQWDDTYEYIQDHNTNYIESNLNDDTFIAMGLNLVLFVDSSGNTVYNKSFDLLNEVALPVPQSFGDYLSGSKSLLSQDDTATSITGLIFLPESPVLITATPILTSRGEGPFRGTLIMGKYLNDTFVEQLKEQTLQNLSLYRFGDTSIPEDVNSAIASPTDDTPTFTKLLNSSTIASYSLMKDVYGDPVLVLEVSMPRTIYQSWKTNFDYFMISVMVMAFIVMTTYLLFLEKQVLSPLSKLSRNVKAIGKKGKSSDRIIMPGKDEISSLAGEINKMLDSIQQFQNELHEKNGQLNGQADELKKKQQELIEKSTELQNASEAKSKFIAAVSHEIRTPLSAVMGFAELMLDNIPGSINEEQRQCLQDIHNSGQHIANLINDILDLSKVEAGKMETRLENLNLPDIINNVVQTMKPAIETSHHQLTVNMSENLPPVYADEKKLKQVILNLLSNANKFTPPDGKIDITVTRDQDWYVVSVTDNGIGIKKEDQERIFGAFVQAENPPDGSKTGTGLGLTLTKKFVEIWGGIIRLTSEYGKGSSFSFTIPVATESKPQPA